MPIDKRRESKLIAVIYADVSGAGDADIGRRLRPALERLNQLFAPAVAEPFAVAGPGRVEGALADPAQAPLCISVLRESLAPLELRVGVGIGTDHTIFATVNGKVRFQDKGQHGRFIHVDLIEG